MITTKLMLDSLHTWVVVHRSALQDYLSHYPYSNYLAIDATNSLRNKIGDIINHIITLIAPHHHYSITHRQHTTHHILSHIQTNALCKIKTLLDDLKIVFLTVGTIKRINTQLILDTLEETIRLASIPLQKKVEPRETYLHRNRSFDNAEQRQRSRSGFMRRYEQQLTKKSREKERSFNIKNELYRQMNEDFNRKKENELVNRQKRIVSEKRGYLVNEVRPRFDYQVFPPKPSPIQYDEEREKPKNRHQKRLFKYLQEDLEDRKKKRQDEERNQFLFETPKQERFQTLPSTGSPSFSSRRKEEELEQYLPEYELDEQKLDRLKKQLDQRLKLSKIQYTDPEVEEDEQQNGVWQQFEKQSTQNQKTVQNNNNLEDSLELMKQEEALNKTGQFNTIPITIMQQLEEYSFSKD